MALDAIPDGPLKRLEGKCLDRKIAWLATEAETAVHRLREAQPVRISSAPGIVPEAPAPQPVASAA